MKFLLLTDEEGWTRVEEDVTMERFALFFVESIGLSLPGLV